MAVYQSKTEPRVVKRAYQEVVAANLIDSIGKRKLINHMRRSRGIPARVKPRQSLTDGGWVFRFDWFEVHTD